MFLKILRYLKIFNDSTLFRDYKGFIFSTDLLLSIIILTIIIGVSADALDYGNELMSDQNSRGFMERLSVESADILIKTPGSPDNWETLSNFGGVSPGLALYNNSSNNTLSVLSWQKIVILSENYKEIMDKNVFPGNIKSSIILYPLNNNMKPIVIHEEPESVKSAEIAVVNRTVQCNFLSNFTLIAMDWSVNRLNNSENISNSFSYSPKHICPHEELSGNLNHTSPTDTSPSKIWRCEHFNISTVELENKDYFLITDPSPFMGESAQWVLDTADNISDKRNSFDSSNIELNSKIKNLMGNKNNATIWIHVIGPEKVNKPFKIFLVGIPKNTDSKYKKAEYFQFQTFYFVLKTWIHD